MTRSNTQKSANILISIFVILSVLLSIGGILLYRYQNKNISIEKHEELAAISKLKVDQIVNWRREQLTNARIIYNNQAIISRISEYNHGVHKITNYQIIHDWINSLFEDYEYVMISLIDSSGKFIINSNFKTPLSDAGLKYIEQARLTKDIVFSDLFRYNDTSIYMDLVVPLFENPTKREGFSGVAFLRIDPNKYLYSKILKWPAQGKSSEVILVRQEGDSVLFLSDLQHKKNSALRLRKSMLNKQLLIVQALNGKKGILEGIDYRGVRVLGDVQTVPGSPWYVVTKIDSAEIFNPIISMATWIFIITFLLILIAAGVFYYVWKRRESEEIIINQQHLQELVDEQTIYLKDLNEQLEDDITERKKTENELRKLSCAVEQNPISIVITDINGIIEYGNPRVSNITGYTPEELLDKNPNIFKSGETPVEVYKELWDTILSGKDWHGEFHNRKKNGELYWEAASISPIIDDEGKITHFLALKEDITQSKLIQEELIKAKSDLEIRVKERTAELAKSEEGFRKLAESIPEFVWITDKDGLNIYFNQNWTEYTGMTMEESHGTGWNKPFHPDDQLTAWNAWIYATENGKNYDLQCRLRKYDGEYHWFVIKGNPLKDSNGDIIRWYGTYTEIDNQKQTEEELEKRVVERTAQLQIANKELEAFAYSVSHDLRAPLRSIDGWSLALLEDCAPLLDKQGLEYLDRVRSETQRMGYLIDDLLKLSKVSRVEIKKIDIDLSTLAQDITKRLLKTPTERRVDFIIQPDMFSYGDPQMMEIALTNLLDNAYKFTGKQPVARIEFGQSMIDNKQTFWVKDNGVGFDMSYSKNLFGAFQRMHKQSDFPGTGVGLATVQRIIHRHNGIIWADSKINQGTTFYFTLT